MKITEGIAMCTCLQVLLCVHDCMYCYVYMTAGIAMCTCQQVLLCVNDWGTALPT